MEFCYSGRIDNLKVFYLSMRKINVQIGTFVHIYNEVISDVILDTRGSEFWQLVFIKRGNGNTLSIPVKRGYRFTIEGDEKYQDFINYFGIGRGKGQFSIKDFVSYLNNQIPPKYRVSDNARRTILRYDKLDNDSDGIYPIGITNWEVVHAKNPMLPKDKYHRTCKNLLKTRELYPEIYYVTKDMDITIIYGIEPGRKTQKIKNIKI
ncbi:MAG: DUF6037 family protein [Evtepia sp.]|nr:DUF6037 family protein [Evtepia sp.]